MRLILALLAFFCLGMQGCSVIGSATDSAFNNMKKEIAELEHKNEELTKSKSVIKTVVETKEVTKIVQSDENLYRTCKLIGIAGIGLSVMAWVILGKLGLGWIGRGTCLGFAAILGLAVVLGIATPYLPYFVLAALSMLFLGVGIYAIKNVNWSKPECKAIKDLHDGVEGAKSNPVIQDILKVAESHGL